MGTQTRDPYGPSITNPPLYHLCYLAIYNVPSKEVTPIHEIARVPRSTNMFYSFEVVRFYVHPCSVHNSTHKCYALSEQIHLSHPLSNCPIQCLLLVT